MKKVLVSIVAILLYSGCVGKNIQSSTTYTLQGKVACTQSFNSDIKIIVDTYSEEYLGKNLYYTQGLKRQKYLLSSWSVSPVVMMQNQIMESFADCGYKTFYGDMQTQKGSTLKIVLQNFEQEFDNNSTSYGYFRAQAWFYDGNVSATKTFQYKIKASTNDAIGGIEALNKANTQFVSELMMWTSKEGSK